MHARFVRSIAMAVAVTGTLTWAPAASAQPAEPTPSASAALTETPVPDEGSVEITTQDPAGDALHGAAFLLLDSAGQEAGRGKTNAQGKLTFPDLAPGVYRLKETASGSALHEVVDDRDVIVAPGTDTPLTIINPFKSASVLLTAKDDKSGKLLAGSTVNIGSGSQTILTLTTGSDGTASGKLRVNSRTGSDFWVKQVKAPAGYQIYAAVKAFKAKPGDAVPVTVTNAKTVTTPPPTEKPTGKPSNRPAPDQPGNDEDIPAPSASGTPTADETASSTAAPAPAGSLAHTGADATPWLIGGAGVLIAAGGGALFAARRRHAEGATDDDTTIG
ncbi:MULTISPECIES: SpaA isopeptide-forming pilin-related protein [unclassified Streptomyces]|uniref:MSCRAMM family protein n=1 Tax=unclassified Streptomyces TaxID=2593676 RepID=UPI002366EBCE|nr:MULTISPECIES: SpaA isopeptide-forming pilin-related protein [unclassified Streptomyces]MDF3145545.1 SpaA isopeptide-forming pilin-related protein [Streptomyces sp. T21Q-yed]WDF43554.1 SpaA isopeptide-forming pilin-related protein [Streptomyces sp. T12]